MSVSPVLPLLDVDDVVHLVDARWNTYSYCGRDFTGVSCSNPRRVPTCLRCVAYYQRARYTR